MGSAIIAESVQIFVCTRGEVAMNFSNENIYRTMMDIRIFFEKTDTVPRDINKIILILEESLLRYRDHFGEDHEFEVSMTKWFGTPKVKIRVKGSAYNPLENDEDDPDPLFLPEIMQNLLIYDSAGTVYRYENGYFYL